MKTIKRNKKGFTFAILDFWSIVFFAVVVILLLIYVNFEKDRDEEVIISKIKGVNTPHYIMNILQSEKVNLSEYKAFCSINENFTYIELLQFFNYKVNEGYCTVNKPICSACSKAFFESFKDSFTDFVLDNNLKLTFKIDNPFLTGIYANRHLYYKENKHSITYIKKDDPLRNLMIITIPSKYGHTKIEIGYEYEQDD